MPKINRTPQGFQSLLDSQNFGVNPSELEDDAKSIVSLDKFLEQPLLRTQTASVAAVLTGSQAVVTIPNNELWGVHNIAGRALNANAAGARIRAQFLVSVPDYDAEVGGGLQVRTLGFTEVPTILAPLSVAESYGGNFQFPTPLMLGPSTQIAVQVVAIDLNGGTSVTLSLHVLFTKYRF